MRQSRRLAGGGSAIRRENAVFATKVNKKRKAMPSISNSVFSRVSDFPRNHPFFGGIAAGETARAKRRTRASQLADRLFTLTGEAASPTARRAG